jgi:riboflavin kinase/FMN adenylyltransferase
MGESMPPDRVTGRVVHGRKLGRLLGFPTANLRLAAEEGPRFGVYAVLARAGGHWHAASASWGTRPHFDDGEPLLEVHLLDFSADLYGCDLEIEFIAKLRDEQVFSSTAALTEQIAADIHATRVLLAPVLRERECLGSTTDTGANDRSLPVPSQCIRREENGEKFVR